METTITVGRADNRCETSTEWQQGPFERLAVNRKSITTEGSERVDRQPLTKSSSNSSSFSIDRILQPSPPPTARVRSTAGVSGAWNCNELASWTAPLQHHHQTSTLSSGWTSYCVNATAQQLGYSTANRLDTAGEFHLSVVLMFLTTLSCSL